MIAYLKGKLAHKEPTYVIVDIQGVGYLVKISLATYSWIKDQELVMLHTYLHIKEDAHTLYGFKDDAEKRLFMALISITGVGPNTAVMVLSSLDTQELEHAILSGDHSTIQRVKGIGTKTAQRIVLELKDKLKKESIGDTGVVGSGFVYQNNKLKQEALQALIMLGFPRAVAEKNITEILKKSAAEISLEDLIKASLKSS
nr:Holliday junction branch migration protein RuvA [Cytophagales bacterium]